MKKGEMLSKMFNHFLYNYSPILGGLSLIAVGAIILFFVVINKFF